MLDNEDIINSIKNFLVNKEETIAVAESVTAGHLQAAFSAGIEASKYFQGGITAYNLGQKARHLRADPIFCSKVNCVAEKIADTMAIEVSKMFLSDYGIGITGYASIVPECEKEGLFAFFSISYKYKIVLSGRVTSTKDQPYEVQINYTNQVVEKFYEYLQTDNKKITG